MTSLPIIAILLFLFGIAFADVSRWSRTAIGSKFDSCRVLQCAALAGGKAPVPVQLFWNMTTAASSGSANASSTFAFALECNAQSARGFVVLVLDAHWWLLRIDPVSLDTSLLALDNSSTAAKLRLSNATANALSVPPPRIVRASAVNADQLASFELSIPASLVKQPIGSVRVLLSDALSSGATDELLSSPVACAADAPTMDWSNRTEYCAAPDDPPLMSGGCTSTRRQFGRNATLERRIAVDWTVECDSQTVVFTVRCASDVKGWFALGFGLSPDMTNADMVMFGDGMKAVDTFSKSNARPTTDAQQDATNVSFVAVADGRQATFTRRWATGDAQDVDLTQPVYLLFAFHDSSDDLSTQHTASGATTARVNLFSVGAQVLPVADAPQTTYRELHIAVMLISWLVLPLPLVAFARFLKALGHSWFLVHRGIGIGITVVGLIGLVLAILHQELGVRVAAHFVSPHSFVGIVVLGLAVLQSILGWVADKMWSPDRDGIPWVPDKLHWWLGRLLVLAAIVAIFLGADRRGGDIVTYVLIAIAVAIQFVMFVVLQFTVGTGHAKSADTEIPKRVTRGRLGVIVATCVNVVIVIVIMVISNVSI